MRHIDELLEDAYNMKASDVHITAGVPPMARVNGKLLTLGEEKLTRKDTLEFTKQLISEAEFQILGEKGELDCAYAVSGLARFRVNIYKQKNVCAIALRLISDTVPSMETLRLPSVLRDLCKKQRGLILVTGATGSGKSTTLASMIDYMNQNLNKHIITIEDPIEYLHAHRSCIINQRQIGKDTLTFSNALRAALRQDPDVILVGEMRDLETISIALTAAETGHLVLSTLHTVGATQTIDRIIDIFPPNQQQQVRVQLAGVLEAVISQQIIPRKDKAGRVVAFEVMLANFAIRNLIREGKTHQLQTVIETSTKENMMTMDSALLSLYKSGLIDQKNLFQYAIDGNAVKREVLL